MNRISSASSLARLVDEIVPLGTREPLGVYVFPSHHPNAELGREVEREVFYEVFGNTEELLSQEYDRYEERSLFFCVVDHRRKRPAGVMRLIIPRPDATCSKSFDDIRNHWGLAPRELNFGDTPIPYDQCWDVATLAVAPEYRGMATAGLVSLSLYQSLARTALACGIHHGIALLDSVLYRMSTWKFGSPFEVLDGLEGKSYLGSETSYPVLCDLEKWRERLSASDPTLCELIFEGKGFGAAVKACSIQASALLAFEIISQDTGRPVVLDLREDLRPPRLDAVPHRQHLR